MPRDEFSQDSLPKTIVVVAPRILLANQLSSEFLEFITDVDVIHVHSGETHHKSTTKTDELEYWYHNSTENLLIFTTYHSLHQNIRPTIMVDTITLMKHTTPVQKNFYLLLNTSHSMQTDVTSLQQHQSIVAPQRKQV